MNCRACVQKVHVHINQLMATVFEYFEDLLQSF